MNIIKKQLSIKVEILVEVTFGVATNNCANFGICYLKRINNNKKVSVCSCNKTNGLLIVYEDNSIGIRFDNKRLPEKIITRYFKDYFIMEEAYEIPSIVYKRQRTKTILLKKGIYKIDFFSSYREVRFR